MKCLKYILPIFLLFSIDAKAQLVDSVAIQKSLAAPPKIELAILGRQYNDSIYLRWAISDPELWMEARKNGFTLETLSLNEDGTINPGANNKTIIKPWTLEEWKQRSNRKDSLSAFAAQLLYGSDGIESGTSDFDRAVFEEDLKINRHAMALMIADRSFHVAEGLALGYKMAKPSGSQHFFRVQLNSSKTPIKGSFLIDKNIADSKAILAPFIEARVGDENITLYWDAAFKGLSGFYIEAKRTGEDYRQINNLPFYPIRKSGLEALVQTEITYDINVPNYVEYTFRIRGFNAFGMLSEYSNEIKINARDKNPPPAPLGVIVEESGSTGLKISWKQPSFDNAIKGYYISRSENMEGPFVPLNEDLIAPNSTHYFDRSFNAGLANFYTVSVVDTAQNIGTSLPVLAVLSDNIPPATPTGFSAKIDTQGIVEFKWNMGSEPDLMGYVIYYANDPEHAFIPITGGYISDTMYTDSIDLKNLTEKIYYQIAAYDYHRNPSKISKVYELKKPDLIPPVAPIVYNYAVTDSTIYLAWHPSSSKDVAKTILYRKLASDKKWSELVKLKPSVSSYTDSKTIAGKWYEYQLVALDDDGNTSFPSFPIKARPYYKASKEVIRLYGKYDATNGNITLNWSDAEPSDTSFFYNLYRKSDKDSGLKLYKRIAGTANSFIDSRLKTSNQYEYKIVKITSGSRILADSKPINIEIKK